MRHSRMAVAWGLIGALASPLAAAAPPGAATPQALVARVQAAAEKNDFGELLACLAPDDRREMSLALVAGVSMMIGFMGMAGDMAGGMAEGLAGADAKPEDKAKMDAAQKEVKVKADAMQKKLDGLLHKHGVDKMMEDPTPLPEEPAARSKALASMFAGTDDIALSKDLLALLEEVGKAEGKEEKPRPPIELSKAVTDYRVDGDTATAMAGEEKLDFVRVDGRWYVRAQRKGSDAPPV